MRSAGILINFPIATCHNYWKFLDLDNWGRISTLITDFCFDVSENSLKIWNKITFVLFKRNKYTRRIIMIYWSFQRILALLLAGFFIIFILKHSKIIFFYHKNQKQKSEYKVTNKKKI